MYYEKLVLKILFYKSYFMQIRKFEKLVTEYFLIEFFLKLWECWKKKPLAKSSVPNISGYNLSD